MDKQIAIGNEDFQMETSAIVDCGFLLTLSSHVSDERTDVAEVFVSVEEAEQIIKTLQEAIDFAKSQNHSI